MMKLRKHWLGLVVAGSSAAWLGCSQDARLAGHQIPSVTVRSVTHYGLTLDQQASPEEVAFVALRAIRDDFEAKTPRARKDALAIQFDLAAANEIQNRNRTSTSRDEFIYKAVRSWTPTVSHYAPNFETEWERAKPRLIRRESKEPVQPNVVACEMAMEVNDPGGDNNARVVLVVWLAKDSGLWRVTHLGFDPERRSIVGGAQATNKGTGS